MKKKVHRRLQFVESLLPLIAILTLVGLICLAVYDYINLGTISDKLYID